jgi:mono/diheme cytochrome c family protein
MKKLGLLLLGCVLALTLGAAAQTKKKDDKAGAGDAAKGEAVFKDKNCTVCHWPDKETKRIGPGLKGLFTHKKMWDDKPFSEKAVREMILKGGGKMTGFEEQLSGKELDNLVAYLKTL